MMEVLPTGIGQTFKLAAAELGFRSAARLFIGSLGGDPSTVEALRDVLGREYPVLDAVAAQWLRQGGLPPPTIEPVRQGLSGCRTVVVVGLEVDFLDPLVAAMPEARFKLLAMTPLPADWGRIVSNYEGQAEVVTLEEALACAGARSAALCFAYGDKDGSLYVPQSWLRFFGRDTKSLFRTIMAWNVVPAPFEVYPRWLSPCPTADFTDVVIAADG
jgi:hypothetical protein